jgi:malate dehydrogenase (oxaloacetate-decarboxylating)(NADP+)
MLQDEALEYHRTGRPGKLAIAITKPCATQRDLALAYTPGVAEPVRQIQADPPVRPASDRRGDPVGGEV